jgi:hypothetical protein
MLSDSDNEKSPPKKMKLNHERNCHNPSDNLIEMLPSNDRYSQLVLPTTQTDCTSTSGNEMNMKKDGTQHMLKSRRQNIINLEHAAANAGLNK